MIPTGKEHGLDSRNRVQRGVCPTLSLVLFVCAGLLLASCSPASPDVSASSSGEAEAAPPDALRVGWITYTRGAYGQSDTVAEEALELRAPVSRVEESVAILDLRLLGDGQATYLEPHTTIYAVRGYDPAFRVAAWNEFADESGGGWALYEVESNPQAERADELLDVRGKVERVSLEVFATEEGEAAGPQRHYWRPEESGVVTNAALDAPLRRVSIERFEAVLTFHLSDGTRSVRVYDPNSGKLVLSEDLNSDRGVVLPQEYRALLDPFRR